MRQVADGGATALVALHDLNLAAAYCDRAVVLSGGRVVAAGDVDDVLVPAVIDRVYDVSTTVLRHPGTGRPVLSFEPREHRPGAHRPSAQAVLHRSA